MEKPYDNENNIYIKYRNILLARKKVPRKWKIKFILKLGVFQLINTFNNNPTVSMKQLMIT